MIPISVICEFFIGFIPIGFLAGGISFLIGFAVLGLINIFKKTI